MSNQFKEVDMKNHVRYHEVVFNHVPLNPCIGCIYRGHCEGEQYAEPGEYCRSKKGDEKENNNAV